MYRQIHVIWLIILSILMVFACNPSYASLTGDERVILSHVDSRHAMHTIERLCANDFAGRRAGSQEEDTAADYLVSQLHGYGLAPLALPGIKGYKQPLNMRYSLVNTKDDIKAILSYGIPKKHGVFQRSRIYPYSAYNGRGGLDLKSEVVFVGYGISDPAEGYDDYSGLNVAGKIVLWLPGRPDGLQIKTGYSGNQKLITAYQHGASACLMYKSASVKDDWGTNVGFSGTIADFPYIGVDTDTAAELLGASRTELGLHAKVLKPGKHGVEVHLHIPQVYDPARRTYNVLATIPGSDPSLAREVVMVGAHYDHLGAEKTGVFRGADDNASGTSVVLETARAIRESGLTPKRSIVFACWTGEEGGLIGSNFFACNPPFALSTIVSNLELDMVGEGTPHTFMTTGARAFPAHYRCISTSAGDLGINVIADKVMGASDHLAFTRKNVPTSLLYSGGEHPYYHTTRDVPSAINRHVLDSAIRLTVLSIWRAANS